MYDELLRNLKTINEDFIYVTLNKWTLDNQDDIIELAQDRMKKGQSVDGGYIGLYAWASYEYFKFTEVNPLAGGKVDLFLTGSLYRGMRIRLIERGKYEIISVDEKYNMLSDKYGSEQFGLFQVQKEEVKTEAMNYLISKIREKYE